MIKKYSLAYFNTRPYNYTFEEFDNIDDFSITLCRLKIISAQETVQMYHNYMVLHTKFHKI